MSQRSRNSIIAVVAAIVVVVVAAVEFRWADAFGRREVDYAALANRPSITFTRPGAGEATVLPNIFVSCDVNLPNTGKGIDADTMNDQTVRIIRVRDGQVVPTHLNTSGAGDAIVCQPDDLLEPSTQYRFEVTDQLRDTGGAQFEPYTMTFTTAAGVTTGDYPVAFEKVQMPATSVMMPGTKFPSAYTAIVIGPDQRLYAATFDGRIMRYTIREDGTLDTAHGETITTVQQANRAPRLVTGIAFDPRAPKDQPVLWVTHGQMAKDPKRIEGADDWTSKVSTLRGSNLSEYQDVVDGLPRAYKDHLTFQPTFGPDGAIYFCQGGNTSTGAPDQKWNFRTEHLLTAACLRLDLKKLEGRKLPIDVKTDEGGTYDPSSADAPLTLYATGVRSGFDLLWHSNGNLYSGLNGAAAGGNTAAGPNNHPPAIENIRETTNDLLLRITRGSYYGHPNPARNQWVLMGGNPTAGPDPQEIKEYPVGTMPEPNWQLPAYDFGKSVSPNGLLEYREVKNAFGGRLDHAILVTRYSGGKDVIALWPDGPDGDITEAVTGIDGFRQFSDPLDLCEDMRNGNLYVAEYGGRLITLLRPKPGAVSQRVFRQRVEKPVATAPTTSAR
jgi:glucose/arabinose dehydrogenase